MSKIDKQGRFKTLIKSKVKSKYQHLITGLCSAIILSACSQTGTNQTKFNSVDSAASSTEQTSEAELVSPILKAGDKPNVVLILIDDLSHYGMTTYGSNVIRSVRGHFPDKKFSTPNIDALAQSGLRVENAFTHPICENTRIALMSGKNNDRNYLRPKSQHASDITFGDVFQKAGYTTGMYGKWKQTRGTKEIAGKDYISEFGWDDYVAFDVVDEGQRFINPNLVINGEIKNYQGRTDLDPETGRRWYGPDIFNRHALQFIEGNKDKPFFLYYPMALVHDDHKPTPDTKPNSIFDNFDETPHSRNGATGDDPKYIIDMIEYTDKLIGKVVNKIDELGLREETLIMVMGDNGTKEIFAHVMPDGSVYPGRKGGNADNGLHVGMVLNQPGTIPAESNDTRGYDGLVYLTDVFPTIAEAAGIEIPQATDLDGISFWQQAMGASGEPRDNIYSWFIGNEKYTAETDPVKIRFAFNKNFKRYGPSRYFPNGRFFDLRTDLLEREGDRYVELRWGLRRYSGLNINNLTPEQHKAYTELGKVLAENELVRVNKLAITSDKSSLSVGETINLNAQVWPKNAKRDGVVWVSSDSNIASVNKFGEVTGHKAGKVEISVYSWDDAEPIASNRNPTFYTDGITAVKKLTVK
ncbi:sulfatase-like hydrolase/transferase [Catenovulum adriaticum]|uniref:Sulfatase-like hydrolase/transferase n=1 Tax=Catenovulum adriaticum TaxID=2984846 RepID=A0ABY7ARC1_9ALTE|nr:sulfatase-like hydrolase/transferase [Catenovulum sp. TS8]WAJ72095.1 sulfatase-like hydrolase/transferase [Catenovulum sp. TS8]